MIDWSPTAARLGYDCEESMWQDLYVRRGLSISKLATKLDVSRNTIRTALERVHLDVRKRGGPNNQKLEVTDELLEEIKQDGIAAVAKRLKLSYTTVYKRVYKARKLAEADLRPEDAERLPDIVASVDSERDS